MLNTNHLLLMLADGTRTAEEQGDHGIASVLREMTISLVESQRHQDDVLPWRQDDLRAIYNLPTA